MKDAQIQRTRLAICWNLDLKKDFFSMNMEEISRLEKLRKICGYRGDNTMGRSKARQFWYYLQKGQKYLHNEKK